MQKDILINMKNLSLEDLLYMYIQQYKLYISIT